MHGFVLAGAMDGALIGAIVGGLAGALFYLIRPARKCPACGEAFPKFGKPRVGPKGGSVCGKCGAEVDRMGRKM